MRTGIDKRPVSGRVMVRTLNVDGDEQGDTKSHGGPDKAVYVYAAEDYAFWNDELGRVMPNHGWFGENLTVEGASSDAACIGDVWAAGPLRLQVTEPRSPCFKLEHKMVIPDFSAPFARSGRVGFYMRVLAEGEIAAGDPVILTERDLNAVSVRALSDMRHFGEGTVDNAERALRLDLPAEWQRHARRMLRHVRAR